MVARAAAAELSAVLVVDELAAAEEVLAHLRAQTVGSRIELVLVVPAGSSVASEAAAIDGFAGVRTVGVPSLAPISAARASGVRAASAPLVFVGETHAFPDPLFAESVIAAHRAEVGAVVPVIENANPDSALSWANHLLNYGPWIAPAPAGEVERAPSYLTTYKCAALRQFDDELDVLFDAGAGLDSELRAAGHAIVLEPRARVGHLHVSKPRSWVADRYLASRVFAAARARRWSRRRRALYCAGAPLIPLVYVGRTLRTAGWRDRRKDLPRGTLGALVAGACLSLAGELAGCARGFGNAPARVLDLELHRRKHMLAPSPR